MPPVASADDIDAFGLEDFSMDFLVELDRAEEAFPSSFCALPPSSALTAKSEDDDEYDLMFLEPCSQEITAALHEMEQPDFMPTEDDTRVKIESSSPAKGFYPGHKQEEVTISLTDWDDSAADSSAGRDTTDSDEEVDVKSSPMESVGHATMARSGSRGTSGDRHSKTDSEDSDSEVEVVEVKKLLSSKSSSPCIDESDSEVEVVDFKPAKTAPIKTSFALKRERSVVDSDDSDSDEEDAAPTKRHKTGPKRTHLSQFFGSYSKFEYDPSGPASQQFQKLRNIYPKSESKALAEGYNRALGLTFSEEYGDDVNSLENWQRLCRAVEIHPVPDSLAGCKYATCPRCVAPGCETMSRWSRGCLPTLTYSIAGAHVNLVDLIDFPATGDPVNRFESERALSEYTLRTRKFFPRDRAYKGPLLRYLLRHIFCPE
ncbi:hypothetical protein C8R46DRAFT_1350388 [Mycena filopes]|nr:hypothetical protein C8R46DRAFT_1350388 [Mycena filopes]